MILILILYFRKNIGLYSWVIVIPLKNRHTALDAVSPDTVINSNRVLNPVRVGNTETEGDPASSAG